MDVLKYSIVYVVVNQLSGERLSVGLILSENGTIKYRYSENKLKAIKELFNDKEYSVIKNIVENMKDSLNYEYEIDYLCRYSNNLISYSQLEKIDLDISEDTEKWLFKHYIDRKSDEKKTESIKCYNCKTIINYTENDVVDGVVVNCPDCGTEICLLN